MKAKAYKTLKRPIARSTTTGHSYRDLIAEYIHRQYGDHGLGGYRGWCRTEGLAAAFRFLDFREAMLGK